MRVFVAVPAYDCKIGVETARSLLNEQAMAQTMGWELRMGFLPGTSLITMARNQLCADFLATDCERMVFVDADVSWAPGSLLQVAGWPVDVVGGAYRYKQPDEAYPVLWLDAPDLQTSNLGLVPVKSLPGGFLSISRGALERLQAAFPGRGYTHMGKSANAFFHAPVRDGVLYGEDAAFCADWREQGGDVWLDPTPSLTHHDGLNSYEGCIGEWLMSRPEAA